MVIHSILSLFIRNEHEAVFNRSFLIFSFILFIVIGFFSALPFILPKWLSILDDRERNSREIKNNRSLEMRNSQKMNPNIEKPRKSSTKKDSRGSEACKIMQEEEQIRMPTVSIQSTKSKSKIRGSNTTDSDNKQNNDRKSNNINRLIDLDALLELIKISLINQLDSSNQGSEDEDNSEDNSGSDENNSLSINAEEEAELMLEDFEADYQLQWSEDDDAGPDSDVNGEEDYRDKDIGGILDDIELMGEFENEDDLVIEMIKDEHDDLHEVDYFEEHDHDHDYADHDHFHDLDQ